MQTLLTTNTDLDVSAPPYSTARRSVSPSGGSIAIDEYIRGVEHSFKRVHFALVASNFQLSLEGHEPPVIPPLKEISKKFSSLIYLF